MVMTPALQRYINQWVTIAEEDTTHKTPRLISPIRPSLRDARICNCPMINVGNRARAKSVSAFQAKKNLSRSCAVRMYQRRFTVLSELPVIHDNPMVQLHARLGLLERSVPKDLYGRTHAVGQDQADETDDELHAHEEVEQPASSLGSAHERQQGECEGDPAESLADGDGDAA